MARRGDVLHEHILDTAKLVFLELGFERTSMDVVAARAATSKRSLYAHFPTKDALFLACIGRMHELFEGRLSVPSHYEDDPEEAVVRYCARFRQLLAYAPILQSCRMGVAEAERLPEASSQLYETYVGTATQALQTHLVDHGGLSPEAASGAAVRLVGATVLPFLSRALFGLERLRADMPEEARLAEDVDLAQVRAVVERELGDRGVARTRA